MAFLLNGLTTLVLTAQSLAPQGSPIAPFSQEAIRVAVATTILEPQAGAPSDWARVTQLAPDTDVAVVAAGQPPIAGKFVRADQAGLTLRLESGGTTTFERTSIQEVRHTTRRRGSKLGMAIGAGVAGFFGVGMAIGLATKDCDGSCTDEKVGIALSLVGMPIGGGFAGYYLWPARKRVDVIYTRPML
jgi:hypothetical protein